MSRPTLEELEARMQARQNAKAGVAPVEPEATPIAAEPAAEQAPAPDEAELLRQELAQMRLDHQATVGRTASTQREADTLRKQLADLTAQNAALQERQQERSKEEQAAAAHQAAIDSLTDEERENYDPEMIDLMARMATRAADARAKAIDPRSDFDTLMSERDAKAASQYRDQMLTGGEETLSRLPALSQDTKFLNWLEDNPSAEYNLNMLVSAKSKSEVDQFARKASREVQRYLAESEVPPAEQAPSAPAQSSLAAGLQRKGGGPVTPQQQEANLQEARRLSRSRNPEDRARAQQLINSK